MNLSLTELQLNNIWRGVYVVIWLVGLSLVLKLNSLVLVSHLSCWVFGGQHGAPSAFWIFIETILHSEAGIRGSS